MSKEPSSQDVVRDIAGAFQSSTEQLAALRSQVAHVAELAQASLRSESLTHKRDWSLRDLGERVYRAVKAGQLKLPESAKDLLDGIKKVESSIDEHNQTINSLLASELPKPRASSEEGRRRSSPGQSAPRSSKK